jgi:hypothetical protein
MSEKHFNPLTLEELTERVIELSERVTRLGALIEELIILAMGLDDSGRIRLKTPGTHVR